MVTPTKESDGFLWGAVLAYLIGHCFDGFIGGGCIFMLALLCSWKSIVWRYSCN